jgi:fructose-bisphosphate aldolase class II
MAHNIKPGLQLAMKYKQFLAMQRKGFALPAVNVTGSSTINGF